MTWSEARYLDNLHAERRAYAWVMEHHGGLPATEAMEAALDCYPYEPADTPYRGLVFHDEAWHWAMPAIHGDRYVTEHPELVHPSPGYLALEQPISERVREARRPPRPGVGRVRGDGRYL
ncbi:hypothetical protein [Streptomyces sp. NPDC096339]|uniref:hypothetical protein n=1 Tax=Streptomyces sp. NPDC096339 TaxID=3366086 RepID=UPI0038165BF0